MLTALLALPQRELRAEDVNVDAVCVCVRVDGNVNVPVPVPVLVWMPNGDGCVKMPPNEFRNKEKVSNPGCSRDRKE